MFHSHDNVNTDRQFNQNQAKTNGMMRVGAEGDAGPTLSCEFGSGDQ